MLYLIMRLVPKDNRHLFIDLWNEEKKMNIEIILAFHNSSQLSEVFNILVKKEINETEITLEQIHYLYLLEVENGTH